jgi:hypothetical protein
MHVIVKHPTTANQEPESFIPTFVFNVKYRYHRSEAFACRAHQTDHRPVGSAEIRTRARAQQIENPESIRNVN